MKKKNNQNNCITEFLYALVLQLIFVPVIGFLSYYVYDKVSVLGSVNQSFLIFFIIIFVIVFINICCYYGLAYLFNRVYNYDIKYYKCVGLISSILLVLFKIFYVILENKECIKNSSIKCLDVSSKNNIVTTIMIFIIAYYLIYIVLDKIVKKSIELRDKEQD